MRMQLNGSLKVNQPTTFFNQGIETTNGWPLGLGNINIRLRRAQNSQPPPAAAAEQPYNNIEMVSPSFSSFSSSNLDTESTASFFPDQSVSLGRLIGIRPAGNRGNLQFQNTINRSLSNRRTQGEITRIRGVGAEETSQQGLCVPLLHNVIEKMSRSKSSSRH
ncbi:hypothetical protein M9H77_25947 [Catharanthus roseus]|uniref:Uncharacterized protein n=1 Tax=Catharanthus roseus TaxID=4058 RepID=A0ACC0A957_CATRO|nr:hypothetical protein M9H77_25947 [Catharanthus roseus]